MHSPSACRAGAKFAQSKLNPTQSNAIRLGDVNINDSEPVDPARERGDDVAVDAPRFHVSQSEKRMEIVTVALLGLAALATAWSGYQASLWDGDQSSAYTQASGARTNAAQARTEANQYRLGDLSMVQNYVDAAIDGDEALADFYADRVRDEIKPAFDAWLALDPFNNPDAPNTPLTMPEYQLAADAEADRLEAIADELFESGEEANNISDIYTLTTLLFAAVLFFAAMAERFEYFRAQIVLLSFAGIGLVAGLIIAFGQPIATG